MAIPSRQIGWGTTDNLLWEISKQIEGIGCVIGCGTSGSGTSGTSGSSGSSGISGTAGTSGTSPSFPYPLVYACSHKQVIVQQLQIPLQKLVL